VIITAPAGELASGRRVRPPGPTTAPARDARTAAGWVWGSRCVGLVR